MMPALEAGSAPRCAALRIREKQFSRMAKMIHNSQNSVSAGSRNDRVRPLVSEIRVSVSENTPRSFIRMKFNPGQRETLRKQRSVRADTMRPVVLKRLVGGANAHLLEVAKQTAGKRIDRNAIRQVDARVLKRQSTTASGRLHRCWQTPTSRSMVSRLGMRRFGHCRD